MPGDRDGKVNPTGSKTEQRAMGLPAPRAGWLLETCGNAGPRWMVATAKAGQNPAYRPAHSPRHSDENG